MKNRQAVRDRIGEILKRPLVLEDEDLLLADVVVESLALVELVVRLQEEFSVRLTHVELREARTLGDLVVLIAGEPAH